jgi:hypothetical protein
MTMHLVGPWLTTTGKKKGRQKYRTADQARAAREHRESGQRLLTEHSVTPEQKRQRRALAAKPYTPPVLNYRGAEQPRIPSLTTTGAPCVKPPAKVYTGDKMIGISQMPKSNAVPIFNPDHIIEIARMRR